jgi:hypothetical protein
LLALFSGRGEEMADVELEIIDLSTGQSIGKFPLILCTTETFELEVGNYRFTVTYLKTGESLYEDRSIIEGKNPPLTFEFSPATYTLRIESTPMSVPVTLNKSLIGSTPQSIIVKEGEHLVEIPTEATA